MNSIFPHTRVKDGPEVSCKQHCQQKQGDCTLIIIIIINIIIMSVLGALDSSCDSLMELLEDLDFAEKFRKRLISKIMNIAIRCTYYIFCRRNKEWTDPNMMDF